MLFKHKVGYRGEERGIGLRVSHLITEEQAAGMIAGSTKSPLPSTPTEIKALLRELLIEDGEPMWDITLEELGLRYWSREEYSSRLNTITETLSVYI